MNRLLFIIISVLVITTSYSQAATNEVLNMNKDEVAGIASIMNPYDKLYNPDNLPYKEHLAKNTRSEVKSYDVTLQKSGTLAYILGDKINDIDSLVVRGPINDEDIYTLWRSTFYGVTTVINLQYAQIEGDRIPDEAFCHPNEQFIPESGWVNYYIIGLRRIILPEGLKELGDCAFYFAKHLEQINFPSSLRRIKEYCFYECRSLNFDTLVIPEGIEEIETCTFVSCQALTAKVVLPLSLKRIKPLAFFSSKITKCNFPEGLEEIGELAFYATRLKEVTLPSSCVTFNGSGQFSLNLSLEKICFPEGLTTIPRQMVKDCLNLSEVNIPNSVITIGSGAFEGCLSLRNINLPSKLKTIDPRALYSCISLTTLSFPSTMEVLEAECCTNLDSLASIHCAAKKPPVCINSSQNPGYTPFGRYIENGYRSGTNPDIPVYVPIGTADLYRNTWGWDYFTNFIEIDNFPQSAIDEIYTEESRDDTIYDMMGRIISQPVPGQVYIQKGKKLIFKHE